MQRWAFSFADHLVACGAMHINPSLPVCCSKVMVVGSDDSVDENMVTVEKSVGDCDSHSESLVTWQQQQQRCGTTADAS